MAKPSMIIDVLAGPGDDEADDDAPLEHDDEEPAPKQDPAALFAAIESQLAELRRAVL